MGPFSLVVNIIYFVEHPVHQRRFGSAYNEGYSIQPEDLARRFPLVFERIGLYCLRLVATGICKTRVTLTRFCVPLIHHPNSPEYTESRIIPEWPSRPSSF